MATHRKPVTSRQLQAEFNRFWAICEQVANENVGYRKQIRELTKRLAQVEVDVASTVVILHPPPSSTPKGKR